MQPRSPSVLVVDDEEDTCRNLSDILTDLGYQVDIAHEGLTALELVSRNRYDVALLDLDGTVYLGGAAIRNRGCRAAREFSLGDCDFRRSRHDLWQTDRGSARGLGPAGKRC